jgi:septum site-determining protein MinC
MPEKSSVKNAAGVAFVLESGTYSILTLVLRDLDIDALDAFIAQQVMRAVRPFDQVPLVIDLSRLPSRDQLTDLPQIVGMLRGHAMVPVGVCGASEEQKQQARALELALMPTAEKVLQRGLLGRLFGG